MNHVCQQTKSVNCFSTEIYTKESCVSLTSGGIRSDLPNKGKGEKKLPIPPKLHNREKMAADGRKKRRCAHAQRHKYFLLFPSIKT